MTAVSCSIRISNNISRHGMHFHHQWTLPNPQRVATMRTLPTLHKPTTRPCYVHTHVFPRKLPQSRLLSTLDASAAISYQPNLVQEHLHPTTTATAGTSSSSGPSNASAATTASATANTTVAPDTATTTTVTAGTRSPSHINMQRIKLVATRRETPLSMAQCLKLGQHLSSKALLKNLAFLNRELPVRFSKRIIELTNLPGELKETEPFMNLIKNYSRSFEELQTFSDNGHLFFLSSNTCLRDDLDIDDKESLKFSMQKEYAELLQNITNRHKQDVISMAHGISLFKRYQDNRNKPSEEIQHFLNAFNRGRLGIRIMVGHHLALQHQFYHLNEPSSPPSAPPPASASAYLSTPSSAHSQRIGIIEPQCDIEALILKAAQSAQFVFFQHYNTVFPPNIHIEHVKEVGGRNVRFPVVPALLHHILFELLKNAMRATAEFHGLDQSTYPDIQIRLLSTANGDLNITIKDYGGGMPSEKVVKPFNYMFTTASNTVCIDFHSIMTAVEKKPHNATLGENLPLCGFGFGLATSKLYARLFHGDLTLNSTTGQGTEANITLKRLEDQIEQLEEA
ncbi:[Pyruvate dehydrogenase (acetyl-transferring)] kinase isozyme 4 [Lobosporangium transversale]|uniref:Protein-serine/threonine kinase n=1 Tax=Lobosporangium transversale TaxID=64571 RepID=A0A1Y2G9U7_9FUNG|nr:mitochondrial branched-chain alpha-ketoacid dehydrogenase kinase-domain-containing protein [Lobosporangium transversale]KAF9915524.1 [Pyruvate dehydrogenase (acetyl-transferring)] kinase isozyme 4 [Lobosporangium transversale]ORZ05121.1 mitochondrial branched-chain alpha-ketoacid dehydrogenase kinase-domain-containing protein [Lobosporangium transversale]|eukprot:XP_021876896.1 mitochondrial branched-chain alpha-ketoacid dehydrogenase kinase-domain-containing protein [Lobosporangium transversale]